MIAKQGVVPQRRIDRTTPALRERSIPAPPAFDPRPPAPRFVTGWPAGGPHQSAPWFNPLDSRHIIIVEQKFPPGAVPARVSFDGGSSWRSSRPLPMLPRWARAASPVLAMDARGTLHLASLAHSRDGAHACLATYRSEDGGLHWSQPVVALQGRGKCSYVLLSDLNPASSLLGRVYLVAAAGSALHVLTFGDGSFWTTGSPPAPSLSYPGPYRYPEVMVDLAGVLHVVWTGGSFNRSILSSYSLDGGISFSLPAVVASLGQGSPLPESMRATCLTPDGVVVCAWTDYRPRHARICCRRSTDLARTWLGPSSGQLVAPDHTPGQHQHQLQPHLLVTPGGEICCSYYEYGPKNAGDVPLVDFVMSVSYDRGLTFTRAMVLSVEPWNPSA